MARPAKRPAAPVRHRPKVARTVSPCGGTVYRMVCTCGQTGRDWPARGPAREELERHITALPLVPAARQCRHPRGHDRRHWEPCFLCEHQTALFDPAGGA